MEKQVLCMTGVKVVLNGGERVLDSATIPIQWFFSKEVLEKNPTHILFFEQTRFESSRDQSANLGRRWVAKVSDGVGFLPVYTPGFHRMSVLVLAGSDAESVAKKFLRTDGKNSYDVSIPWDEAAEKEPRYGYSGYDWHYAVVASTKVEFEVPAQLFAERPKTWFSQLIWKWVNALHQSDPIDQCSYRRRKIFAFTVQPFLGLIFLALALVAGSVYALYVFLASSVVLFCGFRPKPIFRETWGALTFKREHTWSVVERWAEYRRWNYDRDQMKVTGLEVTLILVGLAAIIMGHKFPVLGIIPIVVVIVGWVMVAFMLLVLFNRFPIEIQWLINLKEKRAEAHQRHRQEARERARQKEMEDEGRYQRWLVENFDLDRAPTQIDLKKVPVALGTKRRIIQKFAISYWATKAKVCKPFPVNN